MEQELDGIGPDGLPAKFKFAEGRVYSKVCNTCKEVLGGGIERPGRWVVHNLSECPFCDGLDIGIIYADNECQQG